MSKAPLFFFINLEELLEIWFTPSRLTEKDMITFMCLRKQFKIYFSSMKM